MEGAASLTRVRVWLVNGAEDDSAMADSALMILRDRCRTEAVAVATHFGWCNVRPVGDSDSHGVGFTGDPAADGATPPLVNHRKEVDHRKASCLAAEVTVL